MEVFMRNINPYSTTHDVNRAIAKQFHTLTNLPTNFDLHLFRDRNGIRPHSGCGVITLPTEEIGIRFLQNFREPGPGSQPKLMVYVDAQRIQFYPGKGKLKQDIVDTIIRQPYLDPSVLEEEEKIVSDLEILTTNLKTLHFGRDCRDMVFSSEWEYTLQAQSSLRFDRLRRELCIRVGVAYRIAVWFSQIQRIMVDHRECSIHIKLFVPPSFESEYTARNNKRQRLSSLPFFDDQVVPHAVVAPFTSKSIWLVCKSPRDLSQFRKACSLCGIESRESLYAMEKRNLYQKTLLASIREFASKTDYEVSFQLEMLLNRCLLDASEVHTLQPYVANLIRVKGAHHTAAMLRHFSMRVAELREESGKSRDDYLVCFRNAIKEFEEHQFHSAPPLEDGTFECHHVSVTPTSMLLDGPFPERSSRVIRLYLEFQQHFLRVSFVDENDSKFRFDREVDGIEFTQIRFGEVLNQGLVVGGRRFEFLAYSQSALKEHTVWFCSPFYDPDHGGHINASIIRQSLGSFENLAFDSRLIYCPARYAARLSQAFTATDASITVEVEEVFTDKDIKASQNWLHTDGNGTMSREVAESIWQQQRSGRRHSGRSKCLPAAFQVRFMGSKGMLHIDHTLAGRAIVLRESMIKFDAPDSREIEIARAFDRPGKYYLNRPLITVLEALGVPWKVFMHYQDQAVAAAHDAAQDLEKASSLLDWHGLGVSYRLPSLMQKLKRIGVRSLRHDDFYETIIQYSVNHILRELKHKARIPIPGAYTLVGVADVHGFLKEGEIFVCIQHQDSNESGRFYLEGDILISRSPTSHPGDVQIVRAIGKPPPGSCFAIEPLPNCVVFATKGERPIPSCLGGGDLDGDEYNLIPLENLPEFRPKRISRPGTYDPAEKTFIDHPSTITDVADFVIDYINSDVVGLVATQWLMLADQSEDNVFDRDCLVLSELNSFAVDYAKSGTPVDPDDIPRLKFRVKPDWKAPETVRHDSPDFYKSKRAIGRLFRAINLPALHTQSKAARELRRDLDLEENEDASSSSTMDELEELLSNVDLEDDPVYSRVRYLTDQHINTAYASQHRDEETTEELAAISHRYCSELQHICTVHCLSHSGGNVLTEEEAVAGTIVAQSANFRRRSEMISKLREQTAYLVKRIKFQIIGREEDYDPYQSLGRAYKALEFAIAQDTKFGARSLAWIATNCVFDMTRLIEDENASVSRGSVGSRR